MRGGRDEKRTRKGMPRNLRALPVAGDARGVWDCPAKIAYDYIDERNARIYYTEVRHLHENFRTSYLRRMCMDIKGGRARGKV